MEEDWKPFEIRETEKGKTLYLHGTEESRVKVEADKVERILEAIKRGWNVDIQYAIIDGGIDISEIGLQRDESGRLVIAGRIQIRRSGINGVTNFNRTSFKESAHFGGGSFQETVDFMGVSFNGEAGFGGAGFKERAEFRGASFQETADFMGVSFNGVADFERVSFNGVALFIRASFSELACFEGASFSEVVRFEGASFNGVAEFTEASFNGGAYFRGAGFNGEAGFGGTSFQERADFTEASFRYDPQFGLTKHDELLPDCFASIGRAYRKSMLSGASYFFDKAGHGYWDSGNSLKASEAFRDAKVEYEKEGKYDEAGDMYVWEKDSTRRQIRFEKGKRLKWIWFWLWKHSCSYGESPVRFIGWALAIVLLFGIVYLPLLPNWIRWWPSITFEKYPFHEWGDGLIDGVLFNIGTGIYLSISTFATLSFGNTNPVSLVGKFLVSLELVMGYVMFGILITLVARKMTRS